MRDSKFLKWLRRRCGLCIRVALKDRVAFPVCIIPTDELQMEYKLDLPDHGIRVTVDMRFSVSRGVFNQILDLSLYPKAVEKL